eukprot:15010436-Ditylum_brightwellii.AAC.1
MTKTTTTRAKTVNQTDNQSIDICNSNSTTISNSGKRKSEGESEIRGNTQNNGIEAIIINNAQKTKGPVPTPTGAKSEAVEHDNSADLDEEEPSGDPSRKRKVLPHPKDMEIDTNNYQERSNTSNIVNNQAITPINLEEAETDRKAED